MQCSGRPTAAEIAHSPSPFAALIPLTRGVPVAGLIDSVTAPEPTHSPSIQCCAIVSLKAAFIKLATGRSLQRRIVFTRVDHTGAH